MSAPRTELLAYGVDEETGEPAGKGPMRESIAAEVQTWRCGRLVRLTITRPEHEIEGRRAHLFLTAEAAHSFGLQLANMAVPVQPAPADAAPSPEEPPALPGEVWRGEGIPLPIPYCISQDYPGPGLFVWEWWVEKGGASEWRQVERPTQRAAIFAAWALAERARAAAREQELAAEVERLTACVRVREAIEAQAMADVRELISELDRLRKIERGLSRR